MKVAFLVPELSGLGGIETVVTNLSKSLNEYFPDKYDITFIMPKPKDTNNNTHKLINGYKIIYLSDEITKTANLFRRISKKCILARKLLTMKPYTLFYWRQRELKELKQILNKEFFDIVVATKPYYAINLAMLNKLDKNVVKLVWWHNEPEYVFSKIGVGSRYKEFANKYIKSKYLDGSIVLTDNMKKNHDDKYDLKSYRVYNAVELGKKNIKTELTAVKKIGYVARIDEAQKQISHTIDAFKKIKGNYELLIYGNGVDETIAKKNASDDKRIKFMGRVDDKDKIFASFDVLLVSSKYEGFGLSCIEAMSYGLPVISYDIKNVNELITNDYNSILVEPNNITMLADAIKKITCDIDKYHTLSKNAFETSRKFDLKNFASNFNDVFEGHMKNNKEKKVMI